MRTIKFILTMPNNNAWNGKWSGEDNLYVKFRKVTEAKFIGLGLHEKGSQDFYYNFGDGWGANVEVSETTSKEKKKLSKTSRGFCGYDWMIESILRHGKILNSTQVKAL